MTTDTTETAVDTTKGAETVTPARLRLDAARAALAASALSTSPAAAPTVAPGDIVHCLDDHGFLVMRSKDIFGEPSVTLYRGDEIIVTSEMLDAAKNNAGQPGGIAIAGDEPEQVRRWGKVRLRVGEAPSDLPRWVHGSPEWREAREQARQAAWREPDPDRRAAALREVHRRYGAAPVTSVTLNESPDPSIAAAEAQRRRLDASGPKINSTYAAREAGAER